MTTTLTEFLQTLAVTPDDQVAVAEAAIMIAAADHPGRSIDHYIHYVRTLGPRVRERYQDLRQAGAVDDAATCLAALKFVLHDIDELIGDTETYDDLQNADLIRVIDRRRGLPIALAILYVAAADQAGMSVVGINFPGHFLLRLEHGMQMIIFDPFSGCRILQAADLRALIKRVNGPDAELHADYYQTITRRGMLTRLQNNLKTRLISFEDYPASLRVVERMRLIDPTEYRLCLDAGVLYARLGERILAIENLQAYLAALPPRHPHRQDAQELLDEMLTIP